MAKTKTAAEVPATPLVNPGFKPASPENLPQTSGDEGAGSNYIWVAHKQSKNWDEFASSIPSLRNSNLVVVTDDTVEHVPSPKVHLVEAFRFYADLDSVGEVVKAYNETDKNRPTKAAELVEAVLVVYAQDGPVPARMTFKKAMIRGVQPLIDEYREVLTDPAAWSARSPEHKAAYERVGAAQANLAFIGTMTTHSQPSRQNPKFEYPVGSVAVRPTTSEELAQLNEAMSTDEFRAALAPVQSTHAARVRNIKAKM